MKVIYLFMVFSIIGWLWETPFVSLKNKKYINRGFLRGPYIPIYGCAIVTIILSMGIFSNLNSDNLFVIILQMTYIAVITAIWEFYTSWLLEKVFKTRWWDYSSHKYNIQGRISLYVSFFFGIGGFILYRFIYPLFENLYNTVPNDFMIVIISVLTLVFTIDSVFTLVELFKYRNLMIRLEKLADDLRSRMKDTYDDIKLDLSERRVTVNETIKRLAASLDESRPHPIESFKDRINKLSLYAENNKMLNRFEIKYPNRFNKTIVKLRKYIKVKSKK